MPMRCAALYLLSALMLADTVIEPGSQSLVTDHWVARTTVIRRMVGDSEVARFNYRWTIVPRVDKRGAGILRVWTAIRKSNPFCDSSLVLSAGLTPVWEVAHVGGRTLRFAYEGNRVTVETDAPDSLPRRDTQRYPRPMFSFEVLDDLVSSLPLEERRTVLLPLYSEPTHAFEMDTARVVARDTAGMWTIRSADSSSIVTYRLDGRTRRILAHEVLHRASGSLARLDEVP